jgi:MoaA/NifB/PqqE/SkfB family radical SAM enzyme
MKPATAVERIDYDAILDTIEEFSPKIVNISGGEPTLVEQLPHIVEELKGRWNPFVRVVHNGSCAHKSASLFSHIDRFVVSLDGPGEVNRATRGIDGDKVIERLGTVAGDAEANDVELAINCVVTVHNVSHLRELAEKIRKASPAILLSLTPVMPPDGELSILSKDAGYAEFEKVYSGLKKDGYTIMHTFDGSMRHDTFSCIQCYNQFFTIRVSPEGRVSACPMNIGLGRATANISPQKLLSPKNMLKALKAGSKLLKSRLGAKIDFSCSTICNCESWLDMLFLGKESESADVYLRGLKGRMTEKDYEDVNAFVRDTINANFSIEEFRRRIEAAG